MILMQDMKFNIPVPYTLSVGRELLESTKQKLALVRYPEEQTDFGESSWTQGAKVSRVKQLAEFLEDEHNWEAEEKRLNDAFNHSLVKLNVPGYGSLVRNYTHTPSV